MLQTTLDFLVFWIRVFKSISYSSSDFEAMSAHVFFEVWSGQFLEGPKVFVLGRHSQPWFVLLLGFFGVLEWMTQA